MKTLGRLITAMVTPFDDRGELDYAQAKKLALALVDSGSDGVVLAATTGESPTLVKDEEVRLFTEVKAALAGRGAVIAYTGSNSTAEALEATRKAEKVGVDACLLVVPYYNKPTQEGLYQHFKAIAAVTSLPCILYNVPSRTVVNMSAETVIRLSQIDNIIGVKEASGNLGQIAKIISGVKKDFYVWSGNDGDILPLLAIGGYGVVSVVSHLVGKQIREMMDNYLVGKNEAAARLHRHLMPLVDAMFVVANPIPLKYALNQVGFRVGKPRMPLTEPDEKTAAIIPNHLIASLDDQKAMASYLPKQSSSYPNYLLGRSMVVRKAERLPVECVVRGYLSGSAWAEYQERGTVNGEPMPRELRESEALVEPIFTPTTKADAGHDLPINLRELGKLVGAALAEELAAKSLAIYRFARDYALEKGIIVADTKMEFGIDGEKLILIDELLTPDSSRFWEAKLYKVGVSQPSYDKQPVRDWLAHSGWNKEPPAPGLPPEVTSATSRRYREAYERLTGKRLT